MRALLPLLAVAQLAWTQAQDGEGRGLRWLPDDGPVRVGFHHDGAPGLSAIRSEAALLRALSSWASVEGSDLEFEQIATDYGAPCPHGLPEGWADTTSELCGGPLERVDGDSIVFFMSVDWPFGPEVIGLTTLTWNDEQVLVDADVALNALDYLWSISDDPVDCMTDPEACSVDLQSVALHELGHLVGLDHSSVPGAVMDTQYRPGTLKRELTLDDIEGISTLYPCPSNDCASEVAWEAGCSVVGRPAAWAVAGLLLLLRPRRGSRRAGATLLLLLAWPAQGTVVRGMPAPTLAEAADAVVLARVVDVVSWRDGIVWSAVELEVDEVLAGEAPTRIELIQPGGEAEGWGTAVLGMPRFADGERAVVFLEDGPRGWRVVGLGQGKADVDLGGGLSRDVRGLVRVPFDAGRSLDLPADLDGLRAALTRR